MADVLIYCPVCGAKMVDLYRIERFDPPLQIMRCPACGLQRQAHFPAEATSLASLYDQGYYQGTAAYTYHDERRDEIFQDIVWQARLRTIARHIPPPGRLLDVGCAFGGFVAAAGRAGYNAEGLDLSEYAVAEGRRLNRSLHQGTLDTADFPDKSFDVITLIEVMEHLPDPVQALARIFRLLDDDGLLVLQTANFLGRQARRAGPAYHYYLPGHLFYFSTNNLRQMLLKAGFSDVRFYRGVDFGLLPKLRKMRGGFRSILDYRKWIPVALYHWKSRIAFRDFALTSSMVCYARKRPIP